MEEQKIITIMKPRVTLRRMTAGYNWDISSSESGNLEEIKLIIDELEQANKIMTEKFKPFPKKKIKKEEK